MSSPASYDAPVSEPANFLTYASLTRPSVWPTATLDKAVKAGAVAQTREGLPAKWGFADELHRRHAAGLTHPAVNAAKLAHAAAALCDDGTPRL
ncbi:hypothetical protein [Hymenobacter latericus]|uniref:hypothetical protein n=1 Tax=Hymenobacter sp. YIM 151858-1 TaxID=2987688 RepID=UPI002225FF18|nr:hypothetical protein [Hymenobacter sp. YIM 151858-1]UYZ60123.1 hypothetical protein OIS50_04805 [Hymenobacter sp. YIM 151858-1]